MTGVAETTATTTSDSEARLLNSGLRGYRRPVKAARPGPLQARFASKWMLRGQRQPAGSVHDSQARRIDSRHYGCLWASKAIIKNEMSETKKTMHF